METAVLNNEMNLSYPEGFRVLGAEEISQMNSYKEAPKWCIKDENRHMIIAASWAEKKGFFAAIADTEDVIKGMEKHLRKLLKPLGYQLDGFFSLQLGGRDAECCRYTYEVQGIGMTGEQLVIRKDKEFYYVYSYYRTALSEESRTVLEEIFSSVTWE